MPKLYSFFLHFSFYLSYCCLAVVVLWVNAANFPFAYTSADPLDQKILSFTDAYCPNLGANDFSAVGLPAMTFASFNHDNSSCSYTANGNKPNFIITFYPDFTLKAAEQIDLNSVCAIATCTPHTTVINNHTADVIEQATAFNNSMFATEIYVAKDTASTGVIGFNYIYEPEINRSYATLLIRLLSTMIP